MNPKSQSQFDDVILWIGRPLFKAYVVRHILTYKGTLQILIIGSTLSLGISLFNQSMYDWIGFLYFVGILCLVAATQLLFKIIGYRKTKYWITKQGIYIQTGIIKSSVTVIHKDTILFLDIEKSTLERKYHAGTILIDCGETELIDHEERKLYKRLEAVPNPENVVKLF